MICARIDPTSERVRSTSDAANEGSELATASPSRWVDEVAPLLVGHSGVADLAVEVDVLKYAFERRVGLFERAKRLVEPVADLMVKVLLQLVPPPANGYEERILVEVAVVGSTCCVDCAAALGELLVDHAFALDLEHIGCSLQVQRTEDVLLETPTRPSSLGGCLPPQTNDVPTEEG